MICSFKNLSNQQPFSTAQDAKQQRPSLINSATAAKLMKPARAWVMLPYCWASIVATIILSNIKT